MVSEQRADYQGALENSSTMKETIVELSER